MRLSSLLIRNFRLIQEAALTLTPGLQLFLGRNAQGKTSLIEAIHFLSTSTSHRTRREDELIQWEHDTAFLRGVVDRSNGSERLECGIERKRKLIKSDGVALPRVGDLYGRLRTVLFAPEDIAIVSGGPQERRRFIDMAIAQIEPNYITLLQRYRRVLRQRNQALKRMQATGGAAIKELEIWEQPFLDLAAQVVYCRGEAAQRLAPLAEAYYAGLADDGPLGIDYPPSEPGDESAIRERIRQRLERTRTAEIERGNAQVGPHRDDLRCLLNGKSLTVYGSQGQRRAAALALRLAEARSCRDQVGSWPVLLIDDVVYEMDNTRRSRFWELVDLSGQLIVTATDREHLGATLQPTNTFGVENGQIHPYEP